MSKTWNDLAYPIRAYNEYNIKQKYATCYVPVKRNNTYLEYDLPYIPKSIAFWLKITCETLSSGPRYIMRLGHDTSQCYWELYIPGSSDPKEAKNLVLEVKNSNPSDELRRCTIYHPSSGAAFKNSTNTLDLFDGKWHFINIWFDGFYAYMKVDDLLVQSSSLTSSTPIPFSKIPCFDSVKLIIGSSYTDMYGVGNIYIDELRIDNIIYNPQDYALSFNGSSYVSLANLGVNTAAGAKNTVEFWMYWKGNNYNMPLAFTNYDLYFVNGYFGFNTFNSDLLGISPSSLVNKWVHVAAVFYNGVPSTTNNELYINGVKQTIAQQIGTPVSRTVTSTARVAGATTGGYFFGGYLRDIRIWNRQLTEDEIKSRMYRKLTGEEDGLIAYYDTNEGSSAILYNLAVKIDNSSVVSVTSKTDNGTIVGATYIPYNTNTYEADSWYLSNKPFYDPYDYSQELV